MRNELPHPLAGTLALVASPMKLSKTPPTTRLAPPLLGQHTDAVLDELGLTAAERAALRCQGVI